MNRCPACGATYVNDARFCSQDGARLLPMPDAAAPQPSPESNLVGETLDGRYQILRKIGEGGMSSVYLARDLVSGERRAVKILSGALSSDTNAMERLRREAGLGMRLAHPNVCHIISLGETTDGLVYVVMPFIEGEILADRTNRLGCIPLDDNFAPGWASPAATLLCCHFGQAAQRHDPGPMPSVRIAEGPYGPRVALRAPGMTDS